MQLINDPIAAFTPDGIRTASGEEYAVDLVVLATGFRASDFLLPIDFVGRDGITLEKRWAKDGARAYLGMTIPGFPNLFCLYGPNTNGRANSPCGWGELQSRYAMESIKFLIDNALCVDGGARRRLPRVQRPAGRALAKRAVDGSTSDVVLPQRVRPLGDERAVLQPRVLAVDPSTESRRFRHLAGGDARDRRRGRSCENR